MKLIIAGGRNFENYDLLCEAVDKLTSTFSEVEIVSGGAKGADLLGEHYAIDNN